jgi:P4 family phage/plasmid primase-like protien
MNANICGGDKELYRYLLAWMADAVQNPDKRPGTAIVLRGAQGVGKSIFVSLFGAIFGQHFIPITSPRHLTGNFNAHLKDVCLVFADEVLWGSRESNIGIKLGTPSNGFCDIDCDWPEFRALADQFLSYLPSFGRASSRHSHRVFFATEPEAPKTVQLKLPSVCKDDERLPTEHALCVAELRGNGGYTMFPHSMHPNGEEVFWETPDGSMPNIPHHPYAKLLKQVKALAFLAVVLRCYAGGGGRDEMHFKLAGVLACTGVSADEIDRINLTLATLAKDDEAAKRAKGREAVARFEAGEPVAGMAALVETLNLPDACVSVFNGWLGIVDNNIGSVQANPASPYQTAQQYQKSHYENAMHHNGSFLAYDGACYREEEDATVKSQLYEYLSHAVYKKGDDLQPFNPNTGKVHNVVDSLKSLLHKPAELFDPPCWLTGNGNLPSAREIVACQNGLLHLSSGELLPPTSNFFTRNALEFDYDPDAPLPKKFMQFLHDIWPDDSDSISALQEMFGYLIVSDTSQQKIMLIVGPSRSGKGTLIRVLTKLVGEHNTVAPSLNSLSNDFGMQGLIAKQMATVSDVRISNKADATAISENLLRISGEDKVEVNRKYKNAWQGYLKVRFVIMTNEVPQFADNSGALAKRFIPLMMRHSFYGKENPNLTNELLEELPGILNWAIEGWRRLNERGHFVIPKSGAEVVNSLTNLASPVAEFVTDCCDRGEQFTCRKEDLFNAWKSWCDEQGQPSGKQSTFGRNLLSLGGIDTDRETSKERKNIYVGIRLNEQTAFKEPPF